MGDSEGESRKQVRLQTVKRKLIVRPLALRELEEAITWYEDSEPGLGRRFLDEVRHTIERMIENPGQFPCWRGMFQRAVLRTFPFGLHYRTQGEDIVLVAVYHTSRDPARLLHRR